jgi:glycosyltransferase involved in cell wall biosynthesis
MARPLHILMITGEYPPDVGGVGDYTRRLGCALIERGQRVSVLANGPANDQAPRSEPAVIPLGVPWSWGSWRQAIRVIRLLTPDIVHIQYQTGAYGMHPAINLLPWRLRLLRDRPRIVVTAHDLRLPYLLPKADRLRTWVTTRFFNDADTLIVTNAADEQRARGQAARDREEYSPRTPVRTPTTTIPIGSNITPLLPRGYDRVQWRRGLDTALNTVWLAYFGLMNPTKGLLELIEALAKLPPHFKLLIIGGGAPQPADQSYAARVQNAIRTHGLRERVRMTGQCSEADVSGHLSAADLVVLPFLDGASYRRGSLLAALAHGAPTITVAPQTPLYPALEAGVHALLLPKADPNSIRTAIEQLVANTDLQARLSQGARTLAEQFSWPRIADQHEAVYHTVVGPINEKAKV